MDNKTKSSEAQLRAVKKYNQKTYDTMSLKVKKGMREYYKSQAKLLGFDSFNKFVITALDEKIQREKK